ncbi:MAG: D-alanyl-D-alanine carboxypeptidase [Pseudomonadales bacterium]|nr:D-alanyl-D-alanine carboxypeptidase [Pseudomonadales bacterium]
MKKVLVNKKYQIISIVILIITMFLYKATDYIIFAKNDTVKKFDVYSRDIVEIPVLNTAEIESQSDLSPGEESNLAPVTENDFQIDQLSAKAVYIEDIDTATQLFEKNSERLLLPASTTKIMTALVALEVYSLDQVLEVPDISQIEGIDVGFYKGEKVTVSNLLKAALIQSNNDAAYILALNYSDGYDAYVDLMNKKAVDFGLKNTFFENPAGFDAEHQRSSAHDLAVMSKELMKDEFLRSIVGIKEDIITDISGIHKHYLYNTHLLLGVDDSVVGIKTGTTEGASEVLITQFNRDNRNILIILMGSENRYQETSQLIDWVFNNYIWLTPEQIVQKS